MKKIALIFALALSTQVLLSGCSLTNKQKNNPQQQTTQTQSDYSKSTQIANQNNDALTNDTASSQKSTDASNDKNADASKDANNNQTPSSTTGLKNIGGKDLQTYSTMTKASLIKTLGKDYKLQGSTLTFSNGLSFYGLNSNESKPSAIKCNNNVKIMGISNGMSFSQVQSILGKTSVIETYLGTKTNKVYKIQYSYGKDLFKVISPNKDGKNSFIQVNIL